MKKILEYQRAISLQKIQSKSQRIEEMKNQRYLINEEKKKNSS